MMEMLKLNIDGKTIKVGKGTTILQAAKLNGIEIPTHCHDENLRPYGACRMCMVEISEKGRKKLVASCLYEAADGMSVRTRTAQIDKIRRMIIELTWPQMSRYAEEYGAQGNRFQIENSDCTLCGKCTRYCEDSNAVDIVYFNGRGIARTLELTPNRDYGYDVYRNCMSVCPCGRLMNKLVGLWSGQPQ